MRAIILLAFLTATAAASAPAGHYSLGIRKDRAGPWISDPTGRLPSCGKAARERLAAITSLEIDHDGHEVHVNGVAWVVVPAINARDTAAHPPDDETLALVFRGERQRGFAVLLQKSTPSCADARSYAGSLAP